MDHWRTIRRFGFLIDVITCEKEIILNETNEKISPLTKKLQLFLRAEEFDSFDESRFRSPCVLFKSDYWK